MIGFRFKIRQLVVKTALEDQYLAGRTIRDLIDEKNHNFEELDDIIINLANRWVEGENRKYHKPSLFSTFLVFYRPSTEQIAVHRIVGENGKPLNRYTITKYKGRIYDDIKKWVEEDQALRKHIMDAVNKEYSKSQSATDGRRVTSGRKLTDKLFDRAVVAIGKYIDNGHYYYAADLVILTIRGFGKGELLGSVLVRKSKALPSDRLDEFVQHLGQRIQFASVNMREFGENDARIQLGSFIYVFLSRLLSNIQVDKLKLFGLTQRSLERLAIVKKEMFDRMSDQILESRTSHGILTIKMVERIFTRAMSDLILAGKISDKNLGGGGGMGGF